MWLLTCEGDLLGHKSIWLRPGTQHLLGRTTSKAGSEHVQYIDHKSISRKHLVISIAPVETGSSMHVHTRSKIELTDSSKSGTTVNGEKLHQAGKILGNLDYKIQLGSSEYIFRIKWRPVVLTFTNLSKSLKAKDDPLAQYRQEFEQTDIKLITTYVSNTTTHVIASKRNNPACLQALAQARWTVSYAWVDALLAATRPRADSASDLKSLETDFHDVWPDETSFLIPSGGEPVPRPDSMLLPNDERAEVFSGFTFIFMSSSQHDNLLPVIAACGGKAVFAEVIAAETSVPSFLETVAPYLRDAKIRGAINGKMLHKACFVRADSKTATDWWLQFFVDLELRTGRACIAQGDLLDLILTRDLTLLTERVSPSAAMGLLPVEPDVPRDAERILTHNNIDLTPAATQKGFRLGKGVTQSRFKNFDDFDPDQIMRPISPSNGEPEDPSEIDQITATDEQTSRKRPATVYDVDSILDAQLTGAAAMKKRKLDAGKVAQPEAVEVPTKADPFARKRKDRLVDVKAKLAEQRRLEEEQRLRNEENLSHQLNGLTVEDMKKFAQHQDFDIQTVAPRAKRTNQQSSAEWDASWNGRRNFKAFRRQGERRDRPRQNPVMIALEPMPAKRDGFFDDYFLERTVQQSPSRGPRSNGSRVSSRLDRAGSQARSSNASETVGHDRDERSQMLRAGTQAKEKRPLQDPTVPVAKKARSRAIISIDDEDDDLQFRRRRL